MAEREHRVVIEGRRITTPRLVLRPWTAGDAEAALGIYGVPDVARWLAPALERVPDAAAMRELLERWIALDETLDAPQGRWAIERRGDTAVIGGIALLALPPDRRDLEIGWQLAPAAWGSGLAAEAGHAVAHYAFAAGADEIFAVVRPRNERGAATARRVGMEWVGETDRYYDLRLQVYRLLPADLDVPSLRPEQRPDVD
ncbi:GNAT family N-acetyltransferase [Streptomyces sp. MAA16]|uniref:GNAT family N-acetyltransferase n=1 Tax=Streptomyces sp. MAA16 TaxID=3035116 RepID=UPI0024742BEE|nr:GNAT family N-acetyltransferase [Streptomyces sp. MAA16]MDH6697582.1 RimJ/RimL family protein N-acetyltransferase [Streptomyces sp. MAA16]